MARPKKAIEEALSSAVRARPSAETKRSTPEMSKKLGKSMRTNATGRADGARDVKIPKDGKPGNSRMDQAWLKEQIELGMIEPIDPSDGNVAFGAMKRWKGNPEEVGSMFVLPPSKRRCIGRSRVRDEEGRPIVDAGGAPLLRPCGHWAILGGRVCVKHGGGTEAVQNAAKLRLIAASDALVGALVAIALDPAKDDKARVAAINSALDRAGIKGLDTIRVETPGWERVVSDMFGEWNNGEEGGGE